LAPWHLEARFCRLASKSRDSLYLIDSTVVKAHRAARGAKGEEKSGDRHQSGRSNHEDSRDCRQQDRPLSFAVIWRTGAWQPSRRRDTEHASIAVRGHSRQGLRQRNQQFRGEGALPIIPNRCTVLKKAYCPKRLYRRRHKIENFFYRIKDWRRIATRYDKLARNFLAATMLVAVLYWIKL
jgi:transposase